MLLIYPFAFFNHSLIKIVYWVSHLSVSKNLGGSLGMKLQAYHTDLGIQYNKTKIEIQRKVIANMKWSTTKLL